MKFIFLKKKRFLIPLLLVLFGLTFYLYEKYKAYDDVFYISEVDLYVFTKKQLGGKFLIMFADHKDGVRFSPNIDYIEVNTGTYLKFILDENNKQKITFCAEWNVLSKNQIHYHLNDMSDLNSRELLLIYGEEKNGKRDYPKQYYILDIFTIENMVYLGKTVDDKEVMIKLK